MTMDRRSISEAGLGAKFAERYRGGLRYRHGLDLWLMKGPDGWVGDTRGTVFDLVVEFLAEIARDAYPDIAIRLGRVRTARAVLTVAASKPWIAASRFEVIEPSAD